MSAADAAHAAPPAGRVRAFDLARGLAVLFMVFVHVLAQYGTDAAWASPIGQVVLFFGGPTGAPVFMFLMGASLAFSRRQTFADIARKGLWLLFLAYTLNVLRAAVPASLGLATGFVSEADIAPYTPITSLLLVDIHQMAGLALIVLAAIVGLRALGLAPAASAAVALGVAIAVAFVSPLVSGVTVGQPVVDFVLALLWGTDWYVFFPLFPWMVYPLVGYAYGRAVVGRADRSSFVRRVGLVGVGFIVAAIVVVGLFDPLSGRDLFFRPSPIELLGLVGLVLAWVGLADVVVPRVQGSRALEVLDGWSARVTSMYCIHWILIGWGVALVGRRQLEVPGLLVAMVLILIATDRITITLPFLRGRGRGRPPDREPRRLAIACRGVIGLLAARPRLAALLGAMCIAFSGIFYRFAAVEPSTATFFRCLYGLPLLALVAWHEHRRHGGLSRRSMALAVLAGAFFAGDLTSWHHAIEHVGAGLSTVLGNLAVLVVGIAAWLFLGERPSRAILVSLPVVLLGVVLISGLLDANAYGEDPALGVVLGVATAFFYAAYLLVIRRSGRDRRRAAGPVAIATFSTMIVAGLVGAPLGELNLAPTWPEHGWLFLYGLTSQSIGYLLISLSLPRLPAVVTSIILLAQPVATVVLSMILLRETPSPAQLAGVALVVGGIALATVPVGRLRDRVAEAVS